MPSQLVCRPEWNNSAAVLHITGTLDAVTGDALRQAIRHSLAGQPGRLLLDVAGLRLGDPAGPAALSAVVCEAADWPAVPIVLCGASPDTRAAITAVPGCENLTFAADLPRALAARADEDGRRIRVRLRPVPDACRQVRQAVMQACEAWRLNDAASVATLIATELVANVVRHAHTTMEFTLGLRDGRLSMSVRDGSRRLPRPATPGVSDTGGRGLRLVRELTEAWGVLPMTDGKVVWTRLGAG